VPKKHTANALSIKGEEIRSRNWRLRSRRCTWYCRVAIADKKQKAQTEEKPWLFNLKYKNKGTD
jgi:hypothetical protein